MAEKDAKTGESPKVEETSKAEGKKEEKKLSETEKLQIQVKDLTDTCQRLQADFENFKKRSVKEAAVSSVRAKASLLEKFLPLLDAFDSAMKENNDPGLMALHKTLMGIVNAEGVEEIESVGHSFDFNRHEVVMMQPSDKEDNTILQEVQKGYMHGELVLRYAKVIVSKKEK